MSFFKSLTSFRAKLIVGLIIPVIVIFGFDFYIFTEGRQLEALLRTPPFTQDKILAFEKSMQNFSHIAFLFLSLVIIFNLGIVITLVIILTFSLNMILNGIKRIEGGDLSFRIPLSSRDEFGTIAQFLNLATSKVQIIQQNIEQKVIERTQQLNLAVNQLKLDKSIISAERNKLEVTISGITDAVIAVDLERKIIIFNNAAERLTGYLAKEVLGKTLDQVIRIFDTASEVTPLNYCPIKTGGMEGIIFSKSNLKMVGKRQAFVNLIAGQIAEGLQNNLGCILTLHDVSAEQELEAMKLDFVSMAAHELRTPLTALKGYIQVFSKNLSNVLTDQQKTYLLRMRIATQRLVGLVENLLNVSRIERGSLTIRLEDADWLANVKEVSGELLDQTKDKKQELNIIEPKIPLPKVKVDKFRINEVLSNLLTNAISYTPSGGKITIWFDVTPNEVVTHIQDNGQGIPKDAMPHLFTKFFRILGVLEQGSKGTGLGLYIAKSIISQHKGKIWAESEEGKGSTFSFSIPINPQVVSQIESVPDSQIYIGQL